MRQALVLIGLLLAAGSEVASQTATETSLVEELRRAAIRNQRRSPSGNRSLTMARTLPKNASLSILRARIAGLIDEIGKATRSQLGDVREAFYLLRNQPRSVAALQSAYRAIPDSAFPRKLLVLQILGELQRPDAGPVLSAIVQAPLPTSDSGSAEAETARQRTEMLKAVAVSALAFIRTPAGELDSNAMDEVLSIAQTHPALSVRLTAIDAYLWNHQDSPDVVSKLLAQLPREYHSFVEQARFHRGTTSETFSARLREWRARWHAN